MIDDIGSVWLVIKPREKDETIDEILIETTLPMVHQMCPINNDNVLMCTLNAKRAKEFAERAIRAVNTDMYERCPRCHGSGTVSVEGEFFGSFAPEIYDCDCSDCNGTGYKLKKDLT